MRACVHAAGGGERRRREGEAVRQTRRHTRVTFKLGLRDTISGRGELEQWIEGGEGEGGRRRGFVAARRTESSKFD